MERRRCTREFNAEAVRQAVQPGASKAKVAADLQINRQDMPTLAKSPRFSRVPSISWLPGLALARGYFCLLNGCK